MGQEARDAAKEVGEAFAHRATKDGLHPTMLLMAILYPTVIGFTLQARWWHFSLPHPLSDDEDDVTFMRTMFSFISYTLVHIYLLLHMRIVGSRGVLRLSAPFSWLGPIIFAWVGFAYFYIYASLSRYDTRRDWVATAGFSSIIAMFTLFVLMASPVYRPHN